MKSELVTPAHLARRAIVYIRQSTPAQVVSHQGSPRLQYALGERARELGWRAADVDVVDADLGLSGAFAAGRDGFEEVAARVGLPPEAGTFVCRGPLGMQAFPGRVVDGVAGAVVRPAPDAAVCTPRARMDL